VSVELKDSFSILAIIVYLNAIVKLLLATKSVATDPEVCLNQQRGHVTWKSSALSDRFAVSTRQLHLSLNPRPVLQQPSLR